MSSLVIPIGSWQKPPTCILSCVTATKCGSRVISGSVSGLIIIYKWADTTRLQLIPEYVLVGHKSSILLLKTVEMPVEDIHSQETVLISASEDGEVAMWDLSDGRSLQNNPAAFPGVPSSMEIIGPNGYILISGDHENISILDGSSLEVIKVITFSSLWCPAIRAQSRTQPSDDYNCLVVSGDGKLHLTHFNLQKLDFEISKSQNLNISVHDTCLDLQINEFDTNLALVLTRKTCILFALKPELHIVAKIDCPANTTVWAGGQFQSKKTVLLWTSDSQSFYFFLGPESGMKIESVSKAVNSVTNTYKDSILVADHSKVIFSLKSPPEAYTDYSFTCTAMFPAPERPSLICPVPTVNETAQSPSALVIFEQGNVVNDVFVYVFHYWCHTLPLPSITDGGDVFLKQDVHAIIFNPVAKTPLSSIWPSNKFSALSITVATVILKRYIAVGQASGDILILPLVSPMLGKAVSVMHALKWHRTPITALFVPDFREDGIRKRLLSGSLDGAVCLWNAEAGVALATFSNHAMSVWSFVQIPSEVGAKLDSAIMSLSRDGSIAILDINDCVTLYRFFGHRFDIRAVHWRVADAMMMVLCSDGSLYVRQMKTGHLDRVVRGSAVLDLLRGCDVRVDCNEQQYPNLFIKPKETISVYPVSETFYELPLLLVYQVNIKRLINDVYQGVHALAPQQHQPAVKNFSKARDERKQTEPSDSPSIRKKPLINALKRAKMASWVLPHRTRSVNELQTPLNTNPLAPDMTSLSRLDYDEILPDLSLIQSVFSAILSWGLTEDMDNLCVNRLGLVRPASSVSIGIRGANGFLTFPVPSDSVDVKRDWCMSSFFTATRQLGILSLSRSVLSSQGFEEEIIELLTFYSVILETKVGKDFCFPSLAFLAKYWQDPIVDVQQAARTLFESTVTHVNDQERQNLIAYWKSMLPKSGQKLNKIGMRATIILGIVGADKPSFLDSSTVKEVAESLDNILRDEGKNAYRLLAVEIIGRGFASWEPYINAPNTLRYLVGLTGLVATPPPSAQPIQAQTALVGINGAKTSNIGVTSFQKGAATALAGLGMSAFAHVSPQNTPSTIAQLTPGIMLMARQCLIQIASVNASLFISTLTFDLSHGRPSTESAGSLKLLGMFIAKKPALLFPHLASIVEAMVKTLDPNTPHIREALQQIVTVNFAELVKSYPSISFHAGSQKLAVGTTHGPIVVYDLRTATKIQVLGGHQKAVHAVCYSPDGKLVASYSTEENTVRIFQPHSGFLGTIMGALSGSTAGNATGHALSTVSGAGQVKSFREFHVGSPITTLPTLSKILEQIRFEWVGERELKFFGLDQLELAFRV